VTSQTYSQKPILQARNVKHAFGGKVVHRDISFDLYKGEILTLMGSSGSGKSLILKTLIGLTIPDSGIIHFDGMNLCVLNEDQFRKVRLKIGFIFQNGALFNSMTVEENLSYPLKRHTQLSPAEIRAKVNDRLKVMDVEGTNDLYPHEISGGMEKRVGLLRATMLDPDIVLLDEPTAGLDPTHVALFARTLQRLKKERGYTALFVTHDVECAFAVSDRIAMLQDGVVYATGTVQEMIQTQDPWIRSFLFPDFGGDSHAIRKTS
jgi:phospholipid/cholesterol/gamma-HCH transport system ATP-binding protein